MVQDLLRIQHDGIVRLFEEGGVLIAVVEVGQKAWLLILSCKIICGLFHIAIISSDCVVWKHYMCSRKRYGRKRLLYQD